MTIIEVKGSDEFKIRTKEAMNLLRRKDSVNFRRANRYIKSIEESSDGGYMKDGVFYESLDKLGDNTSTYSACIVHETAHLVLTERFGLDWYDTDKIPENWIKHERFAYKNELRSLRRIDPNNRRIGILNSMLNNPIAIPGRILTDLETTLKANPNCPAETRNQILKDIQRKMAHYNFGKYGPAGLGFKMEEKNR